MLVESDLAAATRVMQRAFGTFLGAPDPDRFMTDRNYVRSRWRADPSAALTAVVDGKVVGSNLVTAWGSVGFFGPLTVAPEWWNRGVASRLLEPTLALFTDWNTAHTGLYTFPHSPKHVGLYQKFGFSPRFLTAVMTRPVDGHDDARAPDLAASVGSDEGSGVLQQCRTLTHAIHDGLDLEREIRAVATQQLGETVLVWDGDRLGAFAVCHLGADTEAGAGGCYVKFWGGTAGARRERSFRPVAWRLYRFGQEPGSVPRGRRRQFGARGGLPGDAPGRFPHRDPRCLYAPAERASVPPAGSLRHRRLAVMR